MLKAGQKTGCGIIGCGNISPWHAEGILKHPDAELVGVADDVKARARRTGEEYGVKWYENFNDLLKRDDIDLVHICTPSGTHAEIAMAAAKAGKHVLVEKPLDVNLEKIDKMITVCRRAKVKLGGIFELRFSDSINRVKKAIDGGKFGRIVLGNMYSLLYRSQEYYDSGGWRGTSRWDGGGAFMNQGIHRVDLLQYLMGPIESLCAYADTLVRSIEVEDTAIANVRFRSGAFGTMQAATSVYPGFLGRIEIYGEKGTVIVKGDNTVVWTFEGEQPELRDIQEKTGEGVAPVAWTSMSKEGHRKQIEDMVDAVREDREPIVNGEEARKAVAIVLAIYESAKTGEPVKLGTPHRV